MKITVDRITPAGIVQDIYEDAAWWRWNVSPVRLEIGLKNNHICHYHSISVNRVTANEDPCPTPRHK